MISPKGSKYAHIRYSGPKSTHIESTFRPKYVIQELEALGVARLEWFCTRPAKEHTWRSAWRALGKDDQAENSNSSGMLRTVILMVMVVIIRLTEREKKKNHCNSGI